MRAPRVPLLLLALTGAALAPLPAGAQLLRGASRVVQTGSSREPEPSRSASGGSSSGASNSGPSRPRAPYYGCGARVMPYPYAYGYVPGWSYAAQRRCWWQPVVLPVGTPGPTVQATRVVLGAEGGWVISTVGRGALSARLDLGPVELSARYALLLEPVEGRVDSVVMGRIDVGYRLADLAELDARVRLGLNHWVDDAGHSFGVAGGLAVDVFPGAPWVLSAEAGGGSLGQAGLVQARATVGAMFGLVEVGFGWDHTTLLTSDGSPGVHLTGPVVMTRLWL